MVIGLENASGYPDLLIGPGADPVLPSDGSGQTPKCTRCGKLGLKCDYADHFRLKKRGSIRETRLLYENKIEKYRTILNCIRNSNTPLLNRLLARLHTDGSLEDILLFIRDEWSAAPITEASSICTDLTSFEHTIADVREDSEAAAFDLSLVDDRPFIRGDAKTWTTVTDDDVLISYLLSSYITWEVNTTPCVDMEIFLAAMEVGDNNFCSPLLVNSILAQGSYHMIGLPDRYNSRSHKYLHHLFFQEALRLWQEENSTASSIATAQAGLVLFRLMCCYDLDTVAGMTMDSILAIIARCVSEAGHSIGRPNGGFSQETDRKMQKSIVVAQRAAFAS
ncbi:hypothetical protein H072_6971 [Dactylellina haptotyla CBS 200.50]|uniref:Zn(2)-C6 fungal-type domain-containing protein n=1 Tax=Dactylellina haptotyla (strain CBS 200.50) TaxID=1284197 RepID=S8A8M5_DACHA|nr:hypothetical protein H072_6971 [Dactylellina haptotyla CBS 200.50]